MEQENRDLIDVATPVEEPQFCRAVRHFFSQCDDRDESRLRRFVHGCDLNEALTCARTCAFLFVLSVYRVQCFPTMFPGFPLSKDRLDDELGIIFKVAAQVEEHLIKPCVAAVDVDFPSFLNMYSKAEELLRQDLDCKSSTEDLCVSLFSSCKAADKSLAPLANFFYLKPAEKPANDQPKAASSASQEQLRLKMKRGFWNKVDVDGLSHLWENFLADAETSWSVRSLVLFEGTAPANPAAHASGAAERRAGSCSRWSSNSSSASASSSRSSATAYACAPSPSSFSPASAQAPNRPAGAPILAGASTLFDIRALFSNFEHLPPPTAAKSARREQVKLARDTFTEICMYSLPNFKASGCNNHYRHVTQWKCLVLSPETQVCNDNSSGSLLSFSFAVNVRGCI